MENMGLCLYMYTQMRGVSVRLNPEDRIIENRKTEFY